VGAALDSDAVITELEGRPLMSAEFIDAVSVLHRANPQHPASRLDGPAVRAAMSVVSARGALARHGQADSGETDATEISTEALALINHLRERPTSTWQIVPESDNVPAAAVQEVLRESARTRNANAEAADRARALGFATWILGALAVAGASLALAWRFHQITLSTASWMTLGVSLAVAVVALGLWKRIRRKRPANVYAGELIAVVGIAAAIALGSVLLEHADGIFGSGTAELLGALALGTVVFGATVLGVFAGLRRLSLEVPWAESFLGFLRDLGVPFVGREPREPAG
jgi:hypothetical protein